MRVSAFTEGLGGGGGSAPRNTGSIASCWVALAASLLRETVWTEWLGLHFGACQAFSESWLCPYYCEAWTEVALSLHFPPLNRGSNAFPVGSTVPGLHGSAQQTRLRSSSAASTLACLPLSRVASCLPLKTFIWSLGRFIRRFHAVTLAPWPLNVLTSALHTSIKSYIHITAMNLPSVIWLSKLIKV